MTKLERLQIDVTNEIFPKLRRMEELAYTASSAIWKEHAIDAELVKTLLGELVPIVAGLRKIAKAQKAEKMMEDAYSVKRDKIARRAEDAIAAIEA